MYFYKDSPEQTISIPLVLPMWNQFVSSPTNKTMRRRELEETEGETVVQNGLKVTADEKRQLATTCENDGWR